MKIVGEKLMKKTWLLKILKIIKGKGESNYV